MDITCVTNVEIIKVHAGQILPCGQVTGNKKFTISDLNKYNIEQVIPYILLKMPMTFC